MDATRKNKLTLCFFCHCVLVYAQAEHWGEFAKSAILPCSFVPAAGKPVIHWTIENPKRNVHSYFYGYDQLAEQDPRFKNRTSLFLSELSKGNASLKIQNLTTDDENTYTCYVSTDEKPSHESDVTLKISRFQQQSIDYEGKNGTFTLNCSIKYCYPESAIDITWYHEEKIEKSDVEMMCLQRIAPSRNPFGPYQCLIHHSKLNQTWQGTWEWLATSCQNPDRGTPECSLCDNISTNQSMEIKLCLNGSENYKLQIVTSGESYFECMLTDITGEYACVSETMHNKRIIVMSIDIKENGKSQNNLFWLLLLIPLGIGFLVLLYCWKRNSLCRPSTAGADPREPGMCQRGDPGGRHGERHGERPDRGAETEFPLLEASGGTSRSARDVCPPRPDAEPETCAPPRPAAVPEKRKGSSANDRTSTANNDRSAEHEPAIPLIDSSADQTHST